MSTLANITISGLNKKLDGQIMVATGLTEKDLEGESLDALCAEIRAFFSGKEGMKLLDRKALQKIREARAPQEKETVVVIKSSDFKPLAKELEPDFKIRNIEADKIGGTVADFTAYFNDRYKKLREILTYTRNLGLVIGTDKISQYTDGKEVTVIGMVYEKFITKKGNLMLNIEDENGTAKIIFSKADIRNSKEMIALFDSASKIVTDEVIAVKGKIVSPFIIASSLIWPDVPVHTRKQSADDLAIAFTSDIHVGSKLFMEKQFKQFIDWLNGRVDKDRELAGKIKYLMIGGDLVDGIGVYPEQDKELTILDIYDQYSYFFKFLEDVPDYIQTFVIPGNHDAVQLADPQPVLSKDIIKEFRRSNVHMLSSPSYVTLDGLKVLSYHGTSLDSVIHGIAGCSYSRPETAMIEMLKRRHISPIYGMKSITPSKSDGLVMTEAPDILHMGHVHKNGSAEYHGTQIVNSGTWQSKTEYQTKLGHMPTPCILPIYQMKKGTMVGVDFNM